MQLDSTSAIPPASPSQKRFAAVVVVVSATAFMAAVPFARQPLTPVPAFIPFYEAALVTNDLITAALLFGQFGFFRWPPLLALAAGYLFTGLIAVAHALSFPGLFTPSGLLGAGPQTTAWLYMFWHAGFPLFVIAYAAGTRHAAGTRRQLRGALLPVLTCVVGVALAVVLLTLLATAGQRMLPAIMSGNGYTSSMLTVVGITWLSSIAGIAFLWRRHPHTVLDVWVMVVLWAWVFDVALSAVLNAGRFDLGFYAGRIYGLVAASFVLVVLLVENAKLYNRLGQRSRELERARQAALEAEQAKGAFLATMSHEIRTPMTGVMGMLELLSLTRLDREQRATLAIVRESGQSLLRIIDDILDFSKIAAGKLELRPEAASIPEVVTRVSNVYSGNASSKGLELRQAIDPRIAPSLRFDAVRLQQILGNLVSNAIKFTESGTISIDVQLLEANERAQVIRLTVEDTGVGISPEDRRKLFTPFAQAGRRTSPSGTGLGLSISRRLAELMGGHLEMESTIGIGTRMSLTLSLVVAELPPTREARVPRLVESATTDALPLPPNVDDARRAGRLVVVIDDHPINRMLLARQLGILGYAAATAQDGSEALALYEAGGVGAIFTDCNMPVMDGYELARRIRALETKSHQPRLPIIACTANALAGEAANCFAAGMDDYLAKPISLDQLRGKLELWLPAPSERGAIEEIIDRAVLAEISSGNVATESEILAQFSHHHRDEERTFKAAVAARDMHGLVQAAHRMRGSSASIGATGLAHVCGRIERAGRANDWDTVCGALGDFDHEYRRLMSHIESNGESGA